MRLFSFWILVFLMGEVNPIVVFSSILLIGCVYFYGFKGIPSTAIRLDFEKTVTHDNLLTTVYRPEVTSVTDTLTYTSKNVTAPPSNLDTIVSEMANILNGRIEAVDKLNHAIKQTSPKVKAGQCCKYKPGDGSYDKNFFTSIDKSNVCFRDGSNECFGFGSKDCSSSYGNEEFLLKAQENLQNLGDNGLAWQYFGDDANGIFSNYPSAFASNCDMYDPRLRPWYMAALSTKPLDIIIVIDTSGSMLGARQYGANEGAKIAINMLRANDRVALVDFDSDAQVPSRSWLDVPTDHKIDDCLGYKLAYATNHNKQNLKNIIDNHFKAEGGTCYSCGLQKAKQIYDNYTKDPNRLRVVLFLSDGEPYDSQWEIEDELQDLTNNYGAITSTFGIQIDNHVLRSMADIGNGDFIHITNVDIPRLTSQVGRFYTTESIYRTNLASEQLYSWSEPYIDAMGMGAMITVSQPVWTNGQLKGVVGVDLTLDYLLEPVAHLQKTQAETGSLPDYYMTLFYLSTEYVISHPFVAIPSEKDATPVKLKQVEPEILSLIPSLANDSAISNDVYTKTFTRQAMNFHEHLVNSFGNGQDTFTAACKRIGTLDFALCEIKKQVAPVTIDRPTTDINDFNGAAKYGRYHRLDLYPRGSIEDDQCYHGYRVATKSSTFALPPKAFDFPVSYGLGNASFDKIQELHSLFNDNANSLTADWDMGPAKMKLDAFEDIKNSVRLTGLILNEHLNLESIKHVWRYFATIDGVMNVKPGVQLPNNYDPTLRPWFKQAIAQYNPAEEKILITAPYVDAFGMGYVVTGIVPHQIGNTTFLVQGEDYLLAEFAKSLLKSHCSGGKKCMIVDNSGYVIWFEGLDRAHNYLLELLPTLTIDGFMITADDKNSNLYRHQRSEAGNDDFDINFRPDLKVSRSTYTSQTTRTASWNYTYCSDVNGQVIKRKLFMDDSILTDIGGVEVKSIPKTNLFIISIYDSLKFQHAYTHSTQKNTHYNFGFKMPSAMSYDSCKNDFPSTIANCQPTPPELNKKYLGQLKTTGFQNEKRTLMMKECSEGVEERLKNSGIFPASDAPKSGMFETAASPMLFKIWIVALILAIAYMIAGSD